MTIAERRAAAAIAVRVAGHEALVERAQRIMPMLDTIDAEVVRRAILAGPGAGLRDVLHDLWRRGVAA